MKKISKYWLMILGLVGAVACAEEYITYDNPGKLNPEGANPEYVMFSDTLSMNMILSDEEHFSVAVASTRACDYDRTFGLEVIDKGSNAIEGYHYRLESNSVTIPAGECVAEVKVRGEYDHFEETDSLGFVLKLVMPEQLKWDLYPDSDQTKVVMYKSCPFEINNFTGWCVLTSLYLYSYPGTNGSYQRLVHTKQHPTEENTIIVESAFYDGYDITLRFNPEDPANPLLEMDPDQVISDEQSVFGQVLGDDHILATDSYMNDSYFNSCQHFAVLWLHVYVEDLGAPVGTVGHFYNILEWVSDEEAKRLQEEDGL